MLLKIWRYKKIILKMPKWKKKIEGFFKRVFYKMTKEKKKKFEGISPFYLKKIELVKRKWLLQYKILKYFY